MIIENVEGDGSRVRWNYGDGWHYADLDDLIRAYESIRHGHWTNISISVTGNSSAECSLCGTVVHDTFADVNRINYCPHCGAKMDGGKDDATND